MRQQLTRISVAQTAGVLALVYAVVSTLFFIPFALYMLAVPGTSKAFGFGGGAVFLILMPLLYAGVTFVVIGLFALIYNFIAGRIGGIEVTWDAAASGGAATPAL